MALCSQIIRVVQAFALSGLAVFVGCSGGGGSSSLPQTSPTPREGVLSVKIELDLQPIQQAAIARSLLGPASTFHQGGTAGELNIEISLIGVERTYTYDPFVPYTLGQLLNNTEVVLDVPLSLFGEYPAGSYVLRFDQQGTWGVNFNRQDVHSEPTLYFNLPGTPASVPVVVPEDGQALIVISVTPQFSHEQ